MAIAPISWPQANINSQVDQGTWDKLPQLAALYNEGQKQRSLAELGQQLAAGTINYQQAAGRVAELGDIGSGLKFLALSEAQKKQAREQEAFQQIAGGLGQLYGGAAPTEVPPAAPAAAPRTPVDPIPGVIRTNPDGSIAGNVTAPSVPAATATPAPPAAAPPAAEPPAATPVPPAPPIAAPTDNQKKIAFLLRSSLNPNADDNTRAVTRALLTRALDESKPIERMQLLQAFKDSDPSLADKSLFQVELMLKQAGQQVVKIEQQQEKAEVTEGAKVLTKRFEKLSEAGDTAQHNLALIGQLRDLRKAFDTGGEAAIRAKAAEYGIKLGKNIDKVEAYSALINRATPLQRPPGSGATTDYEERLYRSGLPQIINTPGGNDIIDATMTAQAEHQLEMARIAEKALAREITHRDALKQMRELPSPYQKFMVFRANGYKPWPEGVPEPKFPRSKEEMDALPVGTQFIDPRGGLRTKT